MRRPQITLKQLFIWTLLCALLFAVLSMLPNSFGASSVGFATLSLILLGDGYRSERSQRDRTMSVSYYSFALSLGIAVAFVMAFIFRPDPEAILRTRDADANSSRNPLAPIVWLFVWIFGYIFFWWLCSTISFVAAVIRWRRFRLAKWLAFLNAPAIVLFIVYIVGTAYEALGER